MWCLTAHFLPGADHRRVRAPEQSGVASVDICDRHLEFLVREDPVWGGDPLGRYPEQGPRNARATTAGIEDLFAELPFSVGHDPTTGHPDRAPRDPPWDDRGLVWHSGAGTALTPSNLRHLLRRQCELAGVRQVTFHTLRHSAATLLLAQGVPSAVILDVLGHQDLRMLRRYQHVTGSLRQDAADAIDRSLPIDLRINDEAPDRISGAPGVGRRGFEPLTSCVSSKRSNQLS